MITVSLNEQQAQLSEGTSLNHLLKQQPPEGAFAVAVNGEFVPRALYDTTQLNDGDRVDLVSPVGGG